MPIFLRSLPLSLGTLWHYIFLLPLVVIASIPFVLLALIPIVGLFVGPAIATFFTFAGYRCALAARGKGNEPSFGRLVRASLFFGFLNTMVGACFMLTCIVIVLGAEKLGFRPAGSVAEGGPMQLLPGVALLLVTLLNALFTCAIAVPMTAVAAAATPGKRDPGPFVGFGQGLFSLSLVWILWFGGIFYFGLMGVLADSFAYAAQHASSALAQRFPDAPETFPLVPFVLAVLYMLWGGCWYYATAVLAWERHLDRQVVQEVEVASTVRMSAEELRALREARMQRPDGS